ncbi:hypothetical protein [Pseudanabaena minima]|uniref:hypothetical protein n=1 Tax=Pseudanabaena minima TaxID=890415 RepID=UPI003DA91AE9
MTENIEIPFEANKDGDIPEDLPLGNYTPLLVPPSLGQSFLQPKFIYPLGAVSLVNPDNLAAENDFEQLNNTFDNSPFFDQPLQSDSLSRVDSQATNQPNIQTKAVTSKNNPQRQVQTERSPIDSPKSNSIQRQTLDSYQAQSLNSQNLSSQEFSVNPTSDHNFQTSLDANILENTSIQRSEDLSSTINVTNSKSDRTERIQSQIQRTSEPSSTSSPNPQLPLNSNLPFLETNIEQSNPSNQDKLVQRQTDERQTDETNLAFTNIDLLVGNRPNQTESNLFTVDTPQSPQTDVVQRQSDSSTTNIQNPQIQLNSDLPIANIDTGNNLAGDLNLQPESSFVNANNANNISQTAQVSQANTLQRQANNFPVNNIFQADLTQPIQRQTDSSISNSEISTDNNTQPSQDPSEYPILDNVADSDRTIQQQFELSPVDRIQIPQTDEIQRQLDIALVDNISQGDLTQQIQRQTDLSPSGNTASINTQQIQRFAESPVLDNISQSDRTIQRESRLSSVDNTQSSQSDSLQQQSRISSDVSNENTIPEVNRTIQRESNLAATDTTQSPQTDAIRTQSNISVDDFSQGDRSIQRESLGTVTDITRSDEIRRQSDVNHISQEDYTQQIQRQSQPDIATVDSSVNNNIQSISKPSESPITKSSLADNVVESDRSLQIQRQPDLTISDSSNSTSSNIQPIQRQPETPISDNSFSQSDRTINRETDLAPTNLGQDSQNYDIQRQTDISLVDSPSKSDRATPQESNLSDNNVTQSVANDEIQRKSDVFTVDNSPQSDRTIQRASELSTVEPTQISQPTQIQRQTDITSIEPPPTINSTQSVHRFSEPPIASESDRAIQLSSTLSNIDIGQSSQNTSIQRQTDQTNIADLPESDSSPTSNNSQQIQSSFEPAVLKNIPESDRIIQRQPESEPTDRTIFPTDETQRQLDVSVANNVSGSEHIQPIQRQPDTSISNDNLPYENIQSIPRTSEPPVLDNINQDNRRNIQRETDLTSPADISQDIQTNEIQRQTDGLEANSIPEKDIQLSSTDITQTPLTDNVQRQPDLFAVDNNIARDSRTQQIQTRPDLSTSDISTNRDSQQFQRFSDTDISTVDQISEGIQRKSSLSPDLNQFRQTDAIQKETDVSVIGSIDQSDRSIQREFDFSPTDDITQSLLTDSLQRESVNAQVDNSIFSNETTQQIQRQADLNISDRNSENDNIQPTQKTSKSPALDHITQDNHTIQREADLSPIDSTQVLQPNEIQRQTNISDVESIAQGDLPIQRSADLSPTNSPQTPQIDIIQRQPNTSTVDHSTSGSPHTQQIQRTSDLSDSDIIPNSNIQQAVIVSESPILDSLSRSDRTQQIQTKPEVSTSDISTNRDSQQIQRIDDTDISTVDSISESIQQKTDNSAIDAISQGDRTIQQRTDLFNNFNNIEIPQSPQINDIQRQPDVAINIAQEDLSQHIQQTDSSISNSNTTASPVEQIQRESDVSTIDIKQNLQTNELQRQTELSDSISQGDRSEEIQSNSDLSPTDSKQSSQANVIQKHPDISTVSNSISEDSLTQQIQRTSDLPNSDIATNSNIQQISGVSESPVLDSLSQGDRTQKIQTKPDISTSDISTNRELQLIQRFVNTDISNVDINSENIQRRIDSTPVELTQSQADETQRQPNISFADNTTQSNLSVQREANLFSNVDTIQSPQTNGIQEPSNISIDSTTQESIVQKTQQASPFIADSIDISNPVQPIQREAVVDHADQSDRTIQREPDLSPTDGTQIPQTNEIQRQTDSSEVDSIAQSDQPIQSKADLLPNDSTSTNPQANVIQRHPDISTVDHNTQQIQRTSNLPDLDITSNSTIQQTVRDSESPILNSITERDRPQQIQRTSDLPNSDIANNSNIQQISGFSESPVLDNLSSQSDRSQQIQTNPDVSTSDISTNRDPQQIQRFVDADISNVDINSENIQRRIDSTPVEITQSQSDATQRQTDISLANNADQGDRTIQRKNDLFNNKDLPISDSNANQQIQRDIFTDHTDQSNRNDIQRENNLSDVSAMNIEQDFQTNKIQRQPDISSVNHNDQGDRNQQIQRQSDVSIDKNIQPVTNFADSPILDSVSQSDRNIQRNTDLPPTNITQTSQTDGIQRQSDVSTVDINISGDNRAQQIQTKADLSTSNIPTDIDLQPIQRFSDADISTVDINSDFSSVDITQSPQANDIQRQSNILQGDLTKQTQQSDSPIDAIQRQSDISATDIPQSNHAIQQESNLSTVNIENAITRSPQGEAIQTHSDVSIVDNISENNSIIQRESDKLDVDITQSSVTNDRQNQLQSGLQREISDSKVDNISPVDHIQQIQRDLDPSEVNNADRTLSIDHTNSIQRSADLVDLNPEATFQMSDNLEHNNLQQIQKKSDPKSNLTTPKKDDAINNQAPVEQNDNQTIIQMLADPSNTQDLQLPKAIKNLAHTNYLGNSLLLPSSQIPSPMTSQTIQRSQTNRRDRPAQGNLPNSLDNLAQTIQPKLDNNSDNSNSQTSSMGWSNISELLANLPPPKASSSKSSLNKQTTNTSDRSPLATSHSSSSTSSTSNQTTIQRSADSPTSDNDQDLYLTPTGLQKGNPNKITNTRSNTIQRELASDTLPEAQVSVNTNHSYNAENFAENLETLAQEIYILLKHRLETERERQGTRYQGRLPW